MSLIQLPDVFPKTAFVFKSLDREILIVASTNDELRTQLSAVGGDPSRFRLIHKNELATPEQRLEASLQWIEQHCQ